MGEQSFGSAYFIAPDTDPIETHVLAVLVANEPGVLARVIGLFSGRGYNIESLTVSETEHEHNLSRITIVIRVMPRIVDQIRHQILRIVPVHRVVDLTLRAKEEGKDSLIDRELVLVKVSAQGELRLEALRLANAFKAEVIDATVDHFIFELAGSTGKVDRFLAVMQPLNLIEVCRSGVVAMNRGAASL